MTPNRTVIRTSPFSLALRAVIAAVCALFAFGATAYGNEPMEPLFDLTQAATLEPQTYRTRSSNISLFPVPQDNAVGTNAAMQPNYNLPANKTQSGIRTRSTPGGNPDNFNELRFEDKKDHEEVFLQAEKDWNIRVKNDKGQTIGRNESLEVGNNRSKTVGVDQSETIGSDKTIHVGRNHVETIGANMNLSVGSCKTELVAINTMETIGGAKELSIGGAYAVTVGGAMNTAVGLGQFEEVGLSKKIIVGKRFDVTTGDRIEIVCGKSKISMDSQGNILISGSNIDLVASGNITMKAQKVKTNG
jgi:type VI secretion system secreted protein VgrG